MTTSLLPTMMNVLFFSNVNIVDEAFLRKLFSLFCFPCQSIVVPPPTPSLLCLYSGECEGSAETECGAEGSSGSHRGANCLPRWPDCDWPGGSGTAHQRQCGKWHQWAEYSYVRGDSGVATFDSHMFWCMTNNEEEQGEKMAQRHECRCKTLVSDPGTI